MNVMSGDNGGGPDARCSAGAGAGEAEGEWETKLSNRPIRLKITTRDSGYPVQCQISRRACQRYHVDDNSINMFDINYDSKYSCRVFVMKPRPAPYRPADRLSFCFQSFIYIHSEVY